MASQTVTVKVGSILRQALRRCRMVVNVAHSEQAVLWRVNLAVQFIKVAVRIAAWIMGVKDVEVTYAGDRSQE